MKRFVLSAAALLLVACLAVSCGSGHSVAVYSVLQDNEIENLFQMDASVQSLTERVEVAAYGENPAFAYELYVERAADLYAGYNLCETVGTYRLYAYEGSVYTKNEEGLCAVVLLFDTYSDFLEQYLSASSPFYASRLNQLSASSEGALTLYRYESEITPQQAARLSSYGVSTNDRILTEIGIDGDDFIHSIAYSVKTAQTGATALAETHFYEKSTEKQDIFAEVASLTDAVSVDILFVGEERVGRHCDVPAGVLVGFETGDEPYDFFLDEACTEPYAYSDGVLTADLTVYAKAKQKD